MKTVQVIPVPRGMTVDESFAEIQAFGHLVEYRWWHRWRRCSWAVVEEEDVT